MPRSKEKDAIQEVTTDEQWLYLLGKDVDVSSTKAPVG